MVQKNKVDWNSNYINDGYLYFAQRIVEMLDHRTNDIYRVPLLNSMRLIEEYIIVNKGQARKYNLEHILSEFKTTFEQDIVVQFGLGEARIREVLHHLNSSDEQRLSTMLFLKEVLGSVYFEWCLKLVEITVPQPREKNKIERIIRCLLPELFYRGYAREEVFTYTNETFFSEGIDPATALANFIAFYNGAQKQYNVYIGVKKTLSIFTNIFEKRFNLSLTDDGRFRELQAGDNYFVLVKYNVAALDATQAAKYIYKKLELFTSFYLFFCNNSTNLILNRVYVVDSYGKAQSINANVKRFTSDTAEDRPSAGEVAEHIITALLSNKECVIPQIEKIVTMHNRAIDNIGLENGFLNFWSLLEMICVTKADDNHFDQIASILIPVLQYNFFSSVITEICINLSNIMDEPVYDRFFSMIQIGRNDYEKLMYMIFLPQYVGVLNDLTDNLINYPVLRSRILNLHDHHKNKKELFNLTEKYAERVKWHLYRIYRARNAITHAGLPPLYIKDLGEHLHSYVDDLIHAVLFRLSFGKLCTISSAIIDCELNFHSISNIFSKKDPFDESSLSRLFNVTTDIFSVL